ncbi:hypothetical protein [Cryomorpha ignava]|uniref:hypothetical protein n=1 Tax=Cryomorpha ignava TaxID=101383 RepID=UPI001EF8BF76|nr:hypothetical protein [Cryomorpha ignava]
MSISGKSESTLKNYAHHVAKMALHYQALPTELDVDQINPVGYFQRGKRLSVSDAAATQDCI